MAAAKAPKTLSEGGNRPLGHLSGPIFAPPRAARPLRRGRATSRGRFYPEAESATRTCYQRDRDRIIHSTAFRRLKHKTQVFVQHEGDYYRTRLTHSLEVAQIARSLARVLALDEDLAEALALAHDLGHTPFGHAGEEALNAATLDIGGFDHNAHALRLVTKLEHRYADFDGLNLTWETLEGLVKHNGPLQAAAGRADRVVRPALAARCAPLAGAGGAGRGAWPTTSPMSITTSTTGCAPNCSRSTILPARRSPARRFEASRARYGELELGRFIGELVRTLMSALVDDVLTETRRADRRRRARRRPRTCARRTARWPRFRRAWRKTSRR